MCTVSFLPREHGFCLAMNRDEKRARVEALPPTIVQLPPRRAVFPREPGGGTWIAANDTGVCVALINWHRVEREPRGKIMSRGGIVPALAGLTSAGEIAAALRAMPLDQLRPFRLITVVAF